MKSFSANHIAKIIDAEVIGNSNTELIGINSLDSADNGYISFVDKDKYLSKISSSCASAIIINKKIDAADKVLFVVKNVNKALISVLNMFADLPAVESGIHKSAVIEEGADVDKSASIGAFCHIQTGAKIGKNCFIDSLVKIGHNCVIGDGTRIYSNVSIYHNCKIGKNCLIQSGAVIGSIGYGYALFENQHNLIPHIGGVIIEDCVDIGANSCIDRAKFGNTIVGAGTKIDNLVQIAHNVIIGKCCLIVSGVGIGGSAKLGNGVVLAGHVGVVEHTQIGNGTMAAAQSIVTEDIKPGMKIMGNPAIEMTRRLRQVAVIQKLPDMARELKELKKKVEKIETAKNN